MRMFQRSKWYEYMNFRVIDVYSKVAWAFTLSKKTHFEVLNLLGVHFNVVGQPLILQSDDGKELSTGR